MTKRLAFLCTLVLVTWGLSAQQQLTVSNPSNCPLNFTLSDNNCPESGFSRVPDEVRILVQNAPGTALGLDVALSEVRLIVDHDWIGDLAIRLEGPSGLEAELIANLGGEGDDLGDPDDLSCGSYTRFGMAACTSVAEAAPPFTGEVLRPLQDLQRLHDGATGPNGTWRLFFCDDLPTDIGTLQYVELVFVPLSCLPLPPPRVATIDTTTVVLDLVGGNDCDLALVEVGSPGFQPGTGAQPGPDGSQLFFLSCTDAALTGLDPDREYEAYVRRYCDATEAYAANSCPVRFTTGCQPPPLTQRTDFDTAATCVGFCGTPCTIDGFWRNTSGDAGDWLIGIGPTPTRPGTGPATDVSGTGKYAYIEANGEDCPAGVALFLQSGCFVFDPQGTDQCHFSFAYHMAGIDIGRLQLQASADGGSSWTTLWERTGAQGADWQKAYISLAGYTPGDTLQLRFGANRTSGPYGDIAVDELRLHGSRILGFPEVRFFADADADGFGDPSRPLASCQETPPPGYTANALDCDDSDPAVNPAAAEVPCNGIDENCNAATLDDDSLLPIVTVRHDTVCSGAPVTLRAEPLPGYLLFWYADSIGEELINVGPTFQPELPPAPADRIYRFYVEATNTICRSARRAEVRAVVRAQPSIVLPAPPALCQGDSLWLDTLGIDDANQTSAALRFYGSLPAIPENELTDLRVRLDDSLRIYPQLATATGCTDVATLTIYPQAGPQATFFPADSFAVCAGTNFDLIAASEPGAGPFSFLWDTGAAPDTLSLRAPASPETIASYTVTITDANGCSDSATARVRTTASIASVQITGSPVSSCGGSDGSFQITPLSGQPPFTYEWRRQDGTTGAGNSAASPIVINDLAQGAYSISVSEATPGSCAIILRNQRIQGPGFSVDAVAVEEPACAGADDGRICITLGGTATANFSWSDGQTTACAENLSAGTYAVTISNGSCTTVETFDLLEPNLLQVRAGTVAASCFDATDGSAFLTPLGGTPPYTFAWSNGAVGNSRIDNLPPGTYVHTLTDARGCTRMDTLLVSAPDMLRITTEELTMISCFGQTDGRIAVAPSGGIPPYQLAWSDGGVGGVREDLSAGTYTVSLTDATGCGQEAQYTITEPAVPTLAVANQQQPLCSGDQTGAVEFTVAGGTEPVQLAWSDGEILTTPARTGLGVGEYWVLVIDTNNCRSDTLFLAVSPQSDPAVQVLRTAPTCVGLDDGRLEIVPGPDSPYRYAWANGDTTAFRNGIGVGDYAVTVTTAAGCVIDTVLRLSAPQVFDIVSVPSAPTCAAASDGLIDQVLLEQGTAPFQFSWNDGSQQLERLNLTAGDYSFTVTDANGCQFYSDTFQLTDPPPLQIDILAQGGSNCANEQIGFVETRTSGGTPPYQFNWLGTGVNRPSIYQLAPGTYRLRVTDAQGCVQERGVTISAAAPFTAAVRLRRGSLCNPAHGDTLVVDRLGGVGPFSYEWSDGSTEAIRLNPPSGGYRVTVTDEQGCAVATSTLKVRARPEPIRLDSVLAFPSLCAEDTTSRIEVYTSGGGDLLRYHFTPTYIEITDSNQLTYLNPPGAASYSVTVTDLTTGCSVQQGDIDIASPTALAVAASVEAGVTCAGGTDGRVRGVASGGVAPYRYLWTNAPGDTLGTDSVFSSASVGLLRLEVTDANGCTEVLTDLAVPLLTEPMVLIDTLTKVERVRCRSGADGQIDVTVAGGLPPLQYAWSNGGSGAAISGLPAGSYTLTVTDAAGCVLEPPPIEVSQPDSAFFIPSVVRNERCTGAQDGFIRLTPSGGTRPYVFSWRRNGVPFNPTDRIQLVDLTAGTYTLVARDAAGCVKRDTFEIMAPPALSVSFLPQGDTLRLITSGGTPPLRYQWSTGSQDSLLTGIAAGQSYGVTITEANDCTTEAQFTVTTTRESDRLAGLRVYPNPFSGAFTLHWPEQAGRKFRLRVMNLTGRVVYERAAPVSLAEAHTVLPGALPAGMYLLVLYEDGRRVGARRLVRW